MEPLLQAMPHITGLTFADGPSILTIILACLASLGTVLLPLEAFKLTTGLEINKDKSKLILAQEPASLSFFGFPIATKEEPHIILGFPFPPQPKFYCTLIERLEKLLPWACIQLPFATAAIVLNAYTYSAAILALSTTTSQTGLRPPRPADQVVPLPSIHWSFLPPKKLQSRDLPTRPLGIHSYPHPPCFQCPPIPGLQAVWIPRLSVQALRAQIWAQHLTHHFSVDQLLNNSSNLAKETLKKLPKTVQNLVVAWTSAHPSCPTQTTSNPLTVRIIQKAIIPPPPSHSWQTLPDWFKCLDWPPLATVPITPKLRS